MVNNFGKYLTLVFLGAFLSLTETTAQDIQKQDTVYHVTDSVRVYFPVSQSVFDLSYMDNAGRIDTVITHLKKIRRNKVVGLDHVSVVSSSSPEGAVTFNEQLSLNRVLAIAGYLKDHYNASMDIMDLEYHITDWERFMMLVQMDPGVPEKDRIIKLIEAKDIAAIQALKGTEAGNYLLENIYPYLRTSFAVFHYTVYLNQIDPRILDWYGKDQEMDIFFHPTDVISPQDTTVFIPEVEVLKYQELPYVTKIQAKPIPARILPLGINHEAAPVEALEEPVQIVSAPESERLKEERRERTRFRWYREEDDDFVQEPDRTFGQLAYHEAYVKTNVLFYPLLIPNLGFEWRPLSRVSASAHGYYSALNWFAPGTKFRVLGLQAEGRYWPQNNMMGPFFGLHFTFGWYNIATGGEYRYQDHQGKKPAYGTGLTLGYKIPVMPRINRGRMGLEFTIGAGVMPLYYDMYYNVDNGRLAGTERKIYWGIDNATISFVYRFAGHPKDKKK